MNLKPLGNNLLVEPDEPLTVSKGGIIIPDNAQAKPLKGLVLAAGDGRQNNAGDIVPMRVKVGDRVLYGPYSGHTIHDDGKGLLLMTENDVFAIID